MIGNRVIEYDEYGPADLLELRTAPEPEPPEGRFVLVRVMAASINPKDTFVRKGRFRAMTGDAFPRRTGYDFSGAVEAVGEGVTEFVSGDAVFGMLNGWSGGACADRLIVPLDEVAPMPERLSFNEATALPLAGITALQALRDLGQVVPGAAVCVNGASGGVGLFAVQIAKALGASVAAIASGGNEALCREAGADSFIDYAAIDPFAPDGARFDVVFDVFGNRSLGEAAPAMSDTGVYVSTVPSPRTMLDVQATANVEGRKAKLVVVNSCSADLTVLANMVARGQLRTHLDTVYALEGIQDAHRHVEGKHTRGKVVVSMEQ